MRAETAREALRRAEFALRNSEHQLTAARAALITESEGSPEPVRILAPIDGTVLARHRESEAPIAAGESLLALGDTSRMEVVADLLSSDAVKVEPGQKVLIHRWGGEGMLTGKVRLVEPSGFTKVSALGVEEQRVNVVIDPDGDNPGWDSLGDGFRVEIQIVIWEEDTVIKVPTSALFREEGEWAVFVREEDKARLRRIEIGQRNGLEAKVISGLEEGDEVVIHPGDAISDGVALEPRR
jgi:HlyD family secretion protein